MTRAEWKELTRFDSIDFGWIIISIGMAIGAGIVFLPVQIGLMGLWVFLLSSVIGYPAMYLFQRLFINTLAESTECVDYPAIISGYLGRNWGIFLGLLYFIMLIIWMFAYSTAITNDSASYLQTFNVTSSLMSNNPLYSLLLITFLVVIASRSERFLFKISSFMVISKISIIAILGFLMIRLWDVKKNIGAIPPIDILVKNAIVTLPFTLTSILFIQILSPMVISYRARNKSIAVARYKAMRAMNVAFGVLFVTVFFYAVSFTFAMSYDDARQAYQENISSLAIAAKFITGDSAYYLTPISIMLNIFAVVTAFFGVYLGFKEAMYGILMNLLRRFFVEDNINPNIVRRIIMLLGILFSWCAVVLNLPVLLFTALSSPIFGLVGCLIPVLLVYKVPNLHKFKGLSLYIIFITGILLCISPILSLWENHL